MDTLVSPTKENSFNQSNDNVVSERSNININKTYMTSQNFLIGAALISIFVQQNDVIAEFIRINKGR